MLVCSFHLMPVTFFPGAVPGEWIFNSDIETRGLHIIKWGSVELTSSTSVLELGPGMVFGAGSSGQHQSALALDFCVIQVSA